MCNSVFRTRVLLKGLRGSTGFWLSAKEVRQYKSGLKAIQYLWTLGIGSRTIHLTNYMHSRYPNKLVWKLPIWWMLARLLNSIATSRGVCEVWTGDGLIGDARSMPWRIMINLQVKWVEGGFLFRSPISEIEVLNSCLVWFIDSVLIVLWLASEFRCLHPQVGKLGRTEFTMQQMPGQYNDWIVSSTHRVDEWMYELGHT